MLHILNVEEIQGLLLTIPEMVSYLDKHDSRFTAAVKEWLSHAEKVLGDNRLAVAGDIAALRGLIISAERGVIIPDMDFTGQKTKRKAREAVAADALYKADQLISSIIKAYCAQITEGERLARQIVVVAKRKGILPVSITGSQQEVLKATWRAITTDSDLIPAVTNLEGLFGATDAMILLDRALPALNE